MKNIDRIVAAYTKMDQRAKCEAVDYMERQAAEYPERAALFIVRGARFLDNDRRSTSFIENILSTTVIRAPEKGKQLELVWTKPLKRDKF